MIEITVLDNAGYLQTFTYDVTSQAEALAKFRQRSRWSMRKLKKRLRRVVQR